MGVLIELYDGIIQVGAYETEMKLTEPNNVGIYHGYVVFCSNYMKLDD